MIVFCLTTVFLLNVQHVYIANIIYYISYFREVLKKKQIFVIDNGVAKIAYISFAMWATISTLIYGIQTSSFSLRTLIQYMFTIQYFILLMPAKFNARKFETWTYRFVLMLSTLIIALYILFYVVSPHKLLNDLWAVNYIPGWPNTPPIPLLMGLWISFKSKKNVIGKILICTALIITGSRIAILGAVIIIGYFYFKEMKRNSVYRIISIPIIIIASIFITKMFIADESLLKKLTVSWDRLDIFKTTMAYLKINPIFGFGGNTLDQLFNVNIDYRPAKNWGHTHNWLLEMLLRYGTVGAILFSVYLLSICYHIKDKDKKFMFVFFIILGLFQTYMRDFVYLFYLLYLSTENL